MQVYVGGAIQVCGRGHTGVCGRGHAGVCGRGHTGVWEGLCAGVWEGPCSLLPQCAKCAGVQRNMYLGQNSEGFWASEIYIGMVYVSSCGTILDIHTAVHVLHVHTSIHTCTVHLCLLLETATC